MKQLLFFLFFGIILNSSFAQNVKYNLNGSVIYKGPQIVSQTHHVPLKEQSDSQLCFPAKNLQGTVFYSSYVNLFWDEPQHQPNMLYWDGGMNCSGIGFMSGGTYSIAQRFTPDELVQYNGYYLTKVLIHVNDTGSQYSHLTISKGVNASVTLLQQPISPIAGQWNEILLTTPIAIDVTQELWIGYTYTQPPASPPYYLPTPAGSDNGPGHTGFGDMISYDSGLTWTTLFSSAGFNVNWSIHGYVTNNQNDTSAIKTLLGFNIIRDGSLVNSNICTSLFFNDFNVSIGSTYQYYVKAIYNDSCISEPSDTVTIGVFPVGVDNNTESILSIFPNPAKEVINIKVPDNTEKIRLINNLGMVAYSENIFLNRTIVLPVINLPAGCYILQVVGKDGKLKNKKLMISR